MLLRYIQYKTLLYILLYNFVYNIPLYIINFLNITPIVISIAVTRFHISSLTIILCGIIEDIFSSSDNMISSIFYVIFSIIIRGDGSRSPLQHTHHVSRILYCAVIFSIIYTIKLIFIILIGPEDIRFISLSHHLLVISIIYVISELSFGYYQAKSK